MRIFVTGGAGFIGSSFIRHILAKYPDDEIINFDLLTYAGNLENLRAVENDPRYFFIRGDVADERAVYGATALADCIVHFAAETHVDRSIANSADFIRTNIIGTHTLLETARQRHLRFHQVSTDEVFGTLGPKDAPFNERSPYQPRSPYSASKAAADHLVRAYFNTYGLPVTISNCSNNYGPFQFPEKLHGLFITNALDGKKLPLYGDGQQVRDWLYVDDHSAGVDCILRSGRVGDTYCIGGGTEKSNLEIAETICDLAGAPRDLIQAVPDRPGHDRRYALDCSKITRELGWRPAMDFLVGMKKTVAWYKDNRAWWEKIKSGEYRDYYARQYGVTL